MRTFLTEYIASDGKRYGFECYGEDFDDAQANADILGLGEVVGRLITSVDLGDLGMEAG